MKRTTIQCENCGRDISRSNYKKHFDSCDGTFFTGPINPVKAYNKRKYKTDEELRDAKVEILKHARTKIDKAWNKGKRVYSDEDVFTINGKGLSSVKERFIKKVDYSCNDCGISSWNGKPIVLELDHKNGNNRDNRLENLQLLCPNCHSQTETYKSKNCKKPGKLKVSDLAIISALKETDNIRQALLLVGLGSHSGNYKRVRKIIKKYEL